MCGGGSCLCAAQGWELLVILLEKSINNCQGCEWVCGAVRVCGCWQKGNFRLWSVVTQQSLNTDCGTGSVTLPGRWSSCSNCSCSAPNSHLDKGALAFFFNFKLCTILKPVKLSGTWTLMEVQMLQLCKNCVYPNISTLKCLLVHHIYITLSF